MLCKRIIPCLDIKDGRVVKGVNFVSLRDAGDPVETAKTYNAAGAPRVSAAHPCLIRRHTVSTCVVAMIGTHSVYLVGCIGTQISAFSHHHTINFDAAFQ